MSVGQLDSTESAAATRSLLLRVPVRAYAALGVGQALQPWTYEPGPLGSDEVEIQVTHCGVCHGDLHLIDNDLEISRSFCSYPALTSGTSNNTSHLTSLPPCAHGGCASAVQS